MDKHTGKPQGLRHARLRRRMKAFDATANDLARRCAVTPQTIRSRLTANTAWTITEIWTIMRYLEIPDNQMYLYFPRDGIDDEDACAPTVEDYLKQMNKTAISNTTLIMLEAAAAQVMKEARA